MKHFMSVLAKKLNINEKFIVLYADADLGNTFCTVEGLDCLSRTHTLKIVPIPANNMTTEVNLDEQSSSSGDQFTSSGLRRSGELLSRYILPHFDILTLILLEQKQKIFDETFVTFLPGKSENGKILTAQSEDLYGYKSYPTDSDCVIVCKALVTTYPCLKEMGSRLGYEAWKNSLKFKMGSLRSLLRNAGVTEIAANSLKKGSTPAKNIKKARRSEANYLPTEPSNCGTSLLDEYIELIQAETMEAQQDVDLIENIMAMRFATRRREIIAATPVPLISDIFVRWPALFTEMQLSDNCTVLT